ncbi:hypothetical protein B0H13DRAFT_2013285 [Mycena leptocephala]|nr:hypothetical protein B0H13DRAFT_2013285 [Mycena leptocephala]
MFNKLLSAGILAILVLGQGAMSTPQTADIVCKTTYVTIIPHRRLRNCADTGCRTVHPAKLVASFSLSPRLPPACKSSYIASTAILTHLKAAGGLVLGKW